MDSDEGKLFVGGIAWDTTEERLSEYFGQYGEVTQTVIMRDKTTGRPRGFGFVVFSEPSALDVVLNEKHTIDGRAVEAKRALSRDEQQQSSANKPGNFSSGGGGRSSSFSSGGGGNFKTKKIFVGGLPSTLSEDAFRHFFEAFGQVTDVVIMYDQTTQRPRGFGFITFDSEDAVDRVLLKNFHELNGKAVEVKRALPKDSNPSSSSSGGGRGGYSGGNTAADGSRYIHQSQTAAGVGGGGGFPAYSGYGAPNYGYAPAGYGSYGVAGLGASYGNPNPPNAAGFVPGAMKATWAPGGQSPAGYSASGYGNTVPWGGLSSGGPTARGPSPSGASGYGYNNYGAYSGGYAGSAGRAPNSNVGPAGGDLMGTGGGYGDNNGGSGYLNSGWRSDPSQPGGGYYGGGAQSRQL